MYEGTIVILNGASSAGKSSLAKSLQSVMPEPFLHLSIDHEAFLFPNHCYDMQQLSDEELTRFWSAFIHSVALYAKFGNRVIFDTVSDSDWVVDECCKAFKDCNVYFIGVHCSLEALQRREIERGDRDIGQAERQLRTVHNYGTYDFAVDTTELPSEQCAMQIKAFIEGNPAPLEFKNLSTNNVNSFVNGQAINDVVLWVGVTFHHVPRDEDEESMHPHWSGFNMIPRDWTAKSYN